MLLLLLPLLGCVLAPVQAFVSPTTVRSMRARASPFGSTSTSPICLANTSKLTIIFSDIDGSLIHYPKKKDDNETMPLLGEDQNHQVLALPPSATGMKGIISSKTLATCRDLRQSKGIKLVLVSGMRTSTLLNRLPYLPKADAYCVESGGRIFYPTNVALSEEEGDDDDTAPNPFQQWTPLAFSGAQPTDLTPFRLREDRKWREWMEPEEAAGGDGYAGNEVFSNRCDELDDDDDDEECLIDYENPYGFPKQKEVIPVRERKGALWDFARKLQQEGFVLDTKSYSTCFRVNQKHQTGPVRDKFQALLKGDIVHPSKLGKSTNLGCIDFYPVSSGKRNCCKYIADELGIQMSSESVCICDDDNDVEMALACSHAYVPALTSDSMKETIRRNPTKFTQTFKQGSITSTLATDAALQLIYDRVAEL